MKPTSPSNQPDQTRLSGYIVQVPIEAFTPQPAGD